MKARIIVTTNNGQVGYYDAEGNLLATEGEPQGPLESATISFDPPVSSIPLISPFLSFIKPN